MRHRTLVVAAALFVLGGFAVPSRAEVSEVSLAGQYGLPYLPFMVMEHEKLIEKHAKALGIPEIKIWGDANYARLDSITVSMAHPDAMAALLSGQGEITSHFASSPFYYEELERPGIHLVLKSCDVLGGPHTNGLLYTTTKFHDANPTVNKAVFNAFKEAVEFIYAKPKAAAEIYLKLTKDKRNSLATLEKWVLDPEVRYTQTPENTMPFVDFMFKVGRIKNRPSSWKDLFFPEALSFLGS